MSSSTGNDKSFGRYTTTALHRSVTSSTSVSVQNMCSGVPVECLPTKHSTYRSKYTDRRIPNQYEKCQNSPPKFSAFPCQMRPPKKRLDGITIYNVYNSKTQYNHDNELLVESTQSDDRPSARQIQCLATDEERMSDNSKKLVLPYWHEEEMKNRIQRPATKNVYDREKANMAWDSYFNKNHKHHHHDHPSFLRNGTNNRPTDRYHHHINKQQHHHGNHHETFVCEVEEHQQIRKSSEKPRVHACKPFYGTAEAEKCTVTAIQHVLDAQNEIKRLQFVTGSLYPQTTEYLKQLDDMHKNLRLFNTQFRELQKRTDNVLQNKNTGHQLTFKLGQPTDGEMPFPSHGLTD